ncbi:hypothetical protein F8388_018062 [Cannabis sativa]|uniref:Uncharacterized protein n=1 Tax=Cannabis sativa TaxID=3483 RepID=A0A7J6HMC3_CANSA|nr:hypothetical protein F8388_018062 [Cannabis sativa]
MGVMSKWACGHYTIRSGSNILINLRIVFKWRFFFGEKVSSCDFDLYNRSEAILQINRNAFLECSIGCRTKHRRRTYHFVKPTRLCSSSPSFHQPILAESAGDKGNGMIGDWNWFCRYNLRSSHHIVNLSI